MRQAVILGMLAVATACSSSEATPCERSADCGAGHQCEDGRCVASELSGGGGGPNAVPAQAAATVVVRAGSTDECTVASNHSVPSGPEAFVAIRDHAGEDQSTGEVYRVVDGEEGVEVSCAVAVTETTFEMDLRLDRASSMLLEARGGGDVDGGTAFVTEWDNQTGSTLSGDCTVAPDVVANGAIYARFSCPQFTDGDLLSCAAEMTVVFENCER